LAREHCPLRELRVREQIPIFDREKHAGLAQKGLDEVTVDTIEWQDEDVIDVAELLVEEVSIDGMCGVY
jgi:mycofactocin precursor